jgi:hypothetical protein
MAKCASFLDKNYLQYAKILRDFYFPFHAQRCEPTVPAIPDETDMSKPSQVGEEDKRQGERVKIPADGQSLLTLG